VQGLALGHARLSNRVDGENAPINREVHSGCSVLIQKEPRAFVRQLFRMTRGERMEGGYSDKMVEEYLGRVPAELMLPFWDSAPGEGTDFRDALHRLELPLLLAQHRDCLLFTQEGFADVAAALPHAHTRSFVDKPSTSPEFAQALEAFCAEVVAVSA
jgi:hypothetical protein